MKNVTKKDLVEKIAEQTGLTRVDTKIIIECFLDSVLQALQNGTNIEIRKFGRFKIKKKRARRARNPGTNQYIDVRGTVQTCFRSVQRAAETDQRCRWSAPDHINNHLLLQLIRPLRGGNDRFYNCILETMLFKRHERPRRRSGRGHDFHFQFREAFGCFVRHVRGAYNCL